MELAQNKLDWLRLILVDGIGSVKGRRLIDRFGNPGKVLNAGITELKQVSGITAELASAISNNKHNSCQEQVDLLNQYQAGFITLDDPLYPAQLKEIYDPPLALFIKGDILPKDYFSVALVGTRMASFYGRKMAEKITSGLVEKDFTIVSGGARGIDTFCHQSALRLKGRTIAVLGCGLDINYPKENKKMFEEISRNGALISEFVMRTSPEKGNFPMRNRIISGLSLGVVVVEAPRNSGSLITVSHALEQGRDIFSVPGEAGGFTTSGSNFLLKEGAKLVESADDVIEDFYFRLRNYIPKKELSLDLKEPQPDLNKDKLCLSPDEDALLKMLKSESAELEDIVCKTGFIVPKVLSLLTGLELKGLIRQLSGKTFQKVQC